MVNSLAPPLYGINQCCLLLQTLQSLTITTVAVCRATSCQPGPTLFLFLGILKVSAEERGAHKDL